ncbi:hypothetical protein PTTG_27402 [Puccinia triticina 1-1 BBBD Race 1]|uniref:Single domain-containing protein n=2 Tax=Puccinia triticina TaxID=208348 RepID=A0A180GKC4_PUCT1|nr:uncharacterized protein PtA15_17A44 [Puccinia triticina]OAV93125.1 hypothetical protein PTTG_27402 [Puccinia triticina 1-1 BBBD Race 1]WAQ92563.1 hypothetical protein PtA15_17A44 [Puccinia triticina]WAR63451.1 hypothetical protein PtB15_17B51 [Puccinia triticina]
MQFLKLSVLTFLAATLGPIQVSGRCYGNKRPVSWCMSYRDEQQGPTVVSKECKLQLTPLDGRCEPAIRPRSVGRYCCPPDVRPNPDGSVDCNTFGPYASCQVECNNCTG